MANSFEYNEQQYTIGDRVVVSLRIEEEGKSRTQNFEGLIIAIKGRGEGRTFTVRRIGAGGIGVERILPLMSPHIESIKLKAPGMVRRAKLYYLRDRVGRKALRVREIKDDAKQKKAPKQAGAKGRKTSQAAATS